MSRLVLIVAFCVACTSKSDRASTEPSPAARFVTAAGRVKGGHIRMDVRIGEPARVVQQ